MALFQKKDELEGLAEKEEKATHKEEDWLLREIKFLEDFRKDVEEIVKLKEEVILLQKSAEQKKVRVLNELIQKDSNLFRRFNRQLNRGERRRIRYEKRVLGNIALIEQKLDEPVRKELEELVKQIEVYSARILTELSWRVGKIAQLTSQKQVEIKLVEQHLNAALEASKALVVLLERLERLMLVLERKVTEKKLIQPIYPQVAGLTGYLREGVIKTAVIKSIVPLRYFLEKGLAKKALNELGRYNKYGQQFHKIIADYTPELSKILTPYDIEQLKRIDYEVPAESTLLFLPRFRKPILAYNIHLLPDFSSRGWVSHAIPGENLEKVSKNGILTAPLEMVFEKKKYFTVKADTELAFRMTAGLSFTFQNYTKYQAYMVTRKGKVGGMFLFPIKNILAPGLILDFANTMDKYPEICLKDEAYLGNQAGIIEEILISINYYSKLEDDYGDILVFFEECKQNVEYLQKLGETLKSPDPQRISQIFVEVYQQKDHFHQKLSHLIHSSEYFQNLLQFIKEDNFLQFSLFVGGVALEDKALIPPLARFSSGQAPTAFEGTIFNQGLDYFNYRGLSLSCYFHPACLTLTFMKKNPGIFASRSSYSLQDYLDLMKKMSPRKTRKLFAHTRGELIVALELIIKRVFRTKVPCVVEARKGVLLVNEANRNEDTIQLLAKRGAIIFSHFSSRSGNFVPGEIDFMVRNIIQPMDLPGGEGYYNQNSYFFLKSGRVYAHLRKSNKEQLVG